MSHSTCTVAYTATARPLVAPSDLHAAMAAVPLDHSWLVSLGAVFSSDNTGTSGSDVTRTLVFQISSPTYQQNFPPPGEAGPFFNVFTEILKTALQCDIAAAAPVLA